jgi:hypothetical protein
LVWPVVLTGGHQWGTARTLVVALVLPGVVIASVEHGARVVVLW